MAVIQTIDERIRPSRLAQIIACPASPGREVGCDDRGNAYAAEGSVAHIVAADRFSPLWAREAWLGRVVEYVDDRNPRDVYPVEVTSVMLDHIEAYHEYVWSWVTDGEPLIEHTVPSRILPNKGTTDCHIRNSDIWHFIDLKYGFSEVSPVYNPQLQQYALDTVLEFLTTQRYMADWYPFPVRLHIFQPRVAGPRRHWDTTIGQLINEFMPLVKTAVEVARQPNAPAEAGDHCKYCAFKLMCDDWHAQAKHITSFEPADVSPGLLQEMYKWVPFVRDWANSVSSKLDEYLRAGNPYITDWKLVEDDGKRYWLDEKKVAALARKKRMSIDDFMPRQLRSVAQLEAHIGKKTFIERGFPLLVEKTKSSAKIVPVDDPRPAVTLGTPPDQFPDLGDDADFDPLAI